MPGVRVATAAPRICVCGGSTLKARLRLCSLIGISLALFALPAAAQNADDRRQPAETSKVPAYGFWPSPTLITNAINRITEEMAEEYEFDDEQLEATRALIFERVPAWLEANRGEIMDLTNQYLEALTAEEPPTPETVATWAQRVSPLIGQFQELAVDLTGRMSEYMTEDQRIRLEGEMAAFATGVQLLQNKLGVWADGGYDPKTEWPRNPESRRQRRAEERAAREQMEQAKRDAVAAANGAAPEGTVVTPPGASEPPTVNPTSPPKTAPAAKSGAKDEWEQYVDDFVKRYQLSSDQASRAYAHLKAHDGYLRKRAADLDAIDKALKNARTDEERAKAKSELERLNAPVERYFRTLKDKLEKIPSREQKRKAGLSAASASKAGDRPAPGAKPANEKSPPAEAPPATTAPERPNDE
jgi:hypothetical protein